MLIKGLIVHHARSENHPWYGGKCPTTMTHRIVSMYNLRLPFHGGFWTPPWTALVLVVRASEVDDDDDETDVGVSTPVMARSTRGLRATCNRRPEECGSALTVANDVMTSLRQAPVSELTAATGAMTDKQTWYF